VLAVYGERVQTYRIPEPPEQGPDVPGWRRFGTPALEPPAGDYVAAHVPARDGFADPPALIVRTDVLAALGGPERVRAGGLADLVARVEEAGHRVESRSLPVPRRRATPAALLREGSGRLWLFRRHPARHPLPRPRDTGVVRWLVLALGALRANAVR
jgi:hypothetical protein